ncbi:hypothetical protein QR680_016771 [Steinernema hermaphroditum]|uniref:Uncharacterized protein n=1 Tax=Steinernema hermaphroditum TaxID=289476 RepID=A0AA39HC89_9BILA|nr:hypothetical protein QR680_016771 [Steinernema hermaphroditum]
MVSATSTKRTGCPILLLLQLLIQFTAAVASGIGSIATLRFDPVVLHDLSEETNRTISLIAEFDRDAFVKSGFDRNQWELRFSSLDENVASALTTVEYFNSSSLEDTNATLVLRKDFQVYGNLIGKTGVEVILTTVDESKTSSNHSEYMEVTNDGQGNVISSTLDVWVTRNERGKFLTKVFVATLVVLITFANILMGCELDLNVVLETVKKPVAPAIGFFTQFFIMPTLAYIIAQSIFVTRGLSSFALGLFVTACAPGGGASNYWTILLDGNAHLSITMTFFSTVASLVMMPLWMHLLGKQFLDGYHPEATIRVPYTKIVSSLMALVIPLLVGVGIQKWKPNVAAKARKIMRPYIVSVLVFVIAFGAYANSYMFFLMTVPALVGGLLLPWCGFMFGCFTSILLRQPPANVTAIAIETGIQNTGIAILLLKFSFPEPDADISALIPVIVASFTPAPLLLGMLVHRVIKAMRKGNENSANDQEQGMNKESSPLEVIHSSSSSLSTRKSYLPKTESDSTLSTRPMIKDFVDCPLLKGAPPNMTIEEQMEVVSEILSDVLTPGVVPR